MIPETSVDWKAFEYKYSNNPERAFENLTYYLFCHEFNKKNGIFRYFNQPHIETNPIPVGDRLIGFQSKYYNSSVSMSDKESELKDAVEGAARAYPGITTIYFYISKEFSPSSKKDHIKPKYQESIEKAAKDKGIEIVWRGLSHIEAQLMQDNQLTICRNVFFQVDSAVQKCCETLYKHSNDIFEHINTCIKYKDSTIVLEHNVLDFDDFLHSTNQILLIDGDAGSGKSAFAKQKKVNLSDEDVILAFRCTDLDVDDKLKFLSLYGSLLLDEVMDVYKEADHRILYIDAAEKYFVLENLQTFEDILKDFVKAGWKVVLTVRTAYKESIHNSLLSKVSVQQFHVDSIPCDELKKLADVYGFKLPKDKKLKNLLCAPFYLGLYLALDNLENMEMLALSRELFEEKIWNDIIRKNNARRNNMPNRREEVLVNITMKMLQSESYFYVTQTTDDYEALMELERSGVIIQTDDARYYCHSHDVFEELVVSHIFRKQYDAHIRGNQFLSQFRPSLRIRKLFRGWLSDFAGKKEHQDIIFSILDGEDVDRIWKNEVLLTVISTEDLKDIYYKIATDMVDDNCEMLKKIIFLINTCCYVADHTDIYLNMGNLWPFRLSKPSGYAWRELFGFLVSHKEKLCWDKELIAIVINVLDSWTKHSENAKTENTKMAGEIGLYLYQKISGDRDLKYTVRDEQIEKLQDVLCNSAWMIQEQLSMLFQTVIEGKTEERTSDPFAMDVVRINAPSMYIDLAERAVSNIYHYGNVPYAMPEMTIRLMNALWIRPIGAVVHYSIDMDGYFGLSAHLSNHYYPASAYQTPVVNMLQNSQDLMTDFLIDFCNKAGAAYMNSHLNTDYNECFKIVIHVGSKKIEQVASDRLWKMYRGTHVGPDLLVSLLMGFEQWLLTVVNNSEADIVVDYCRYVMEKSQNVMLTAVIVSVAEAYPDKMLDVVCDLLKTKEIFRLDSSRIVSEESASFLMYGKNFFEKERLQSNKLPHRRIRLEDIIREYQTNTSDNSDDSIKKIQKLYDAIDEATIDINQWSTSDKYAYYRMDLRHYKEVIDVQSDDEGHEIYTVMPDFSEDMKELSKQSQEAYHNHLKYADLQLWSDYKFCGNEQYKKYGKYLDITVACKELREIWELLCSSGNQETTEFDEGALNIYRYISIASYTSAVLLRDYKDAMQDEDYELCRCIVLELGNLFTQVAAVEMIQAGNGLEAVAAALVLLINEENRQLLNNENPLYLLLKLVLRDWRCESRIIQPIADSIWKQSTNSGWRFIYALSLLADQYEKEMMQNRECMLDDFLEEHQNNIEQALLQEVVDATTIDFTKLSNITVFTIIMFVSPYTKDAVTIVEATKDIAMKITFADKKDVRDERRDLIGYTLNYVKWFADVLLYCDDDDRKVILHSFLERADISENDNIEQLLVFLIQEQEIYGKVDEFWSVWELLKPKMIELGNKKERYYYSNYNGPVGRDRVITAYLFANSPWRKNVYRCELLSEKRNAFFDDFVEKSGSVKAMFYALAKLVNTVGKEAYKECGIEWFYKLVLKDPECKLTLYDNTLYYLEEYMGSLVAYHRTEFRMDAALSKKTQTVLEYMVEQGSQIAFFLGEQI